MITLHGFPFSNYYNIVKHVLLHKQIPFEEHIVYGATEDYLAISPTGKVPALTTEAGKHLSESSVGCDYLEETYPLNPLYPSDSYERARVRQIMKVSELYLELPARRFIPFVFGNRTAPEELKAEVRATLQRGVDAMTRLCSIDPYLAGSSLSMADIYVRYVLKVVAGPGSSTLGWDIVGAVPGLTEWSRMMDAGDIARRVDADQEANAPEFFAYVAKMLGS